MEQGKQARLSGQDSFGQDLVRGQLTPSAESGAADAVLAMQGHAEQVRGRTRMRQLPVGQRYQSGEHRHSINVQQYEVAANPNTPGQRGAHQARELRVALRCQDLRDALVDTTPCSKHTPILPDS
jgi:hypothetical protein